MSTHTIRLTLKEPQLINCADLAYQGIENILSHDPRFQTYNDDEHCHCWREDPSPVREHGEVVQHAWYDMQQCDRMHRLILDDGRTIEVCCRCADHFEGGVSEIADRLLILEQAEREVANG